MPKGIYKDAYRFDVRATANGVTRFASFPLDTPLRAMRNWQEEQRAAIRRSRVAPLKGCLEADVDAYLKRPDVMGRPGFRNRKYQLRWWVTRLGPKRRHNITPQDVQAGLDDLAARGVGAGTRIHYYIALTHLWRVLDGRQAYCPAKDAEKPQPPRRVIRSIPEPVLANILSALPTPPSKTSARILVMAETGFPPAILGQIRPMDIDLEHATVTVPPRHKAEGVDGRIVPITRAAVEAFRLWISLGASGRFNVQGLNHAFKAAAARVGVEGISVYALRHTFLTRALRLTNGNIEAVQGLALHASKATTEWYTRAAVPEILTNAIATMNGNLAEVSSSVEETPMKTVH